MDKKNGMSLTPEHAETVLSNGLDTTCITRRLQVLKVTSEEVDEIAVILAVRHIDGHLPGVSHLPTYFGFGTNIPRRSLLQRKGAFVSVVWDGPAFLEEIHLKFPRFFL